METPEDIYREITCDSPSAVEEEERRLDNEGFLYDGSTDRTDLETELSLLRQRSPLVSQIVVIPCVDDGVVSTDRVSLWIME